MRKLMKMAASTVLVGVMALSLLVVPAAASETASSEGEKVYRTTIGSNITNLNPLNYNMSNDGDTINFLFIRLLVRNPISDQWDYIGAAAEGLPEVSEDGLVWTYKIREGLEWSDGTPINAHSFEYTERMKLDPKLVNRQNYNLFDTLQILNARAYFNGDDMELHEQHGTEPVEWEDVGIKALDDYTLEYTFEVRPLDITAITWLGANIVHEPSFEAGFNEDRTENSYGTKDWVDMPVSGPYRLTQYEADQYYVFEKRDEYVLADHYPIERREVRWMTQPNVLDQMFEAGLTDFRAVTGTNFDLFGEDPRVLPVYWGQPWYVCVNMKHEEKTFLADVNFRKALSYATDRETIAYDIIKTANPSMYYIKTDSFVGDVLAGEEVTSYRSLPEAQAVVPENHGYDPELALEYFEKAYVANGSKKISVEYLYHEGSETTKMMAEFLQESWETLFGRDKFELTLASQVSAAAYQTMREGKYELGYGAMGQSTTDPFSIFNVHTTSFATRHTFWENEEFDAMYDRLNKGDLVFAPLQEKIEFLAEMEAMFLDQLPVIPVFQSDSWQIYSDRVHFLNRVYAPGIGYVIVDLDAMGVTDMAEQVIDFE